MQPAVDSLHPPLGQKNLISNPNMDHISGRGKLLGPCVQRLEVFSRHACVPNFNQLSGTTGKPEKVLKTLNTRGVRLGWACHGDKQGISKKWRGGAGRLMGVNTWQSNEATCDEKAKRGVGGRSGNGGGG